MKGTRGGIDRFEIAALGNLWHSSPCSITRHAAYRQAAMVDLRRPLWPNKDGVKGVAGYTANPPLIKRSLGLSTRVTIRWHEASDQIGKSLFRAVSGVTMIQRSSGHHVLVRVLAVVLASGND
jgi:hypothetical protein